jgi:hypothetical protein
MAKRRQESRDERQNRGYDEAVKRGPVATDRPDRMVPEKGDKTQRQNTTEDVDDAEAGREP